MKLRRLNSNISNKIQELESLSKSDNELKMLRKKYVYYCYESCAANK